MQMNKVMIDDCVPSEQTVMHQTTVPHKLSLVLISRHVPFGIPVKKENFFAVCIGVEIIFTDSDRGFYET